MPLDPDRSKALEAAVASIERQYGRGSIMRMNGVEQVQIGTISTGARYGLPVSVCGEMAGDPLYTELLLGMGLRNFSMHPGNILEIKQQVLRADLGELAPKVQRILKMDEPARIREAMERLTT